MMSGMLAHIDIYIAVSAYSCGGATASAMVEWIAEDGIGRHRQPVGAVAGDTIGEAYRELVAEVAEIVERGEASDD